jgi:uncharacterized protein YecT (DUF1311 family)
MKAICIKSLLFASLLFCSCCSFSVEMAEKSACDELKISQKKLDTVYKQLLSKYSSDPIFIRKLKKSQQIWVVYKEAQIELTYPHGHSAEYGSIYTTCKCLTLDGLTADRTNVLEQWLTGIEMGDVCTGSRPTR